MGESSSSDVAPRAAMTGASLKLELKLGLWFAAGAIFISALLTFGLYTVTVGWLRQGLRERIRDAAAIAASQLDGDAFAELTDPSQEGKPAYLRLRSELQRIRDAGNDYRFVYTLRRAPDGKIIFVVDAEENPDDLSHLGEHYDDAGPALVAHIDTLDEPVVEEEFYTDKWGTWLTGYAPVRRSDGGREVVLAMDIAAATVVAGERRFLWTALAVFGVTLPLSVAAGGVLGRRLARPITALTRGAERITGGDLDHVVQIHCRDEIGELAAGFNTMTRKLSHSLESLRRSEEELTRHRDDLEATVRERTRRLTAANERMNHDLESAARVQQTFLPQQPPEVPGVRFAWNLTPCEELAGDMLDICRLGPLHVGIWVADVCGHGVAAALVSVTLSRLLATLGEPDTAPDRLPAGSEHRRMMAPPDVAAFLNERFPWDPEAMSYFTLLYGILDVETSEFHYVSAGHPGPLLVPAVGESRILPMSPPAVGLLPDPKFVEHRVTLQPGDRLYLFTDGITETVNADDEEFGVARLTQALAQNRSAPLDASVASLLAQLAAWRGRKKSADDISLLALELAR